MMTKVLMRCIVQRLTIALPQNEEHFSADEIGEMLAFAVDPETGNCNYTGATPRFST